MRATKKTTFGRILGKVIEGDEKRDKNTAGSGLL